MRVASISLAVLSVVFGQSIASANPFSFRVQGAVASLFEVQNALPADLAPGSEFEAQITFDPELLTRKPSPVSGEDLYVLDDGAFSATVNIGGHAFAPRDLDATGGLGSTSVWILDGPNDSPDRLSFNMAIGSPSSFPVPLPVASFKLTLVDKDGIAFDRDDVFPNTFDFPSTFDLRHFEDGSFQLDATSMVIFTSKPESYKISGTIHAVQALAVPEPNAVGALLSAIVSLGVWARRYSADSGRVASRLGVLTNTVD